MSSYASHPARPVPLRPVAVGRSSAAGEVLTREPVARRPVLREPLWRHLVGGVLRRERRAQQRTLKDVADTARISMPYLSEVERGRKEASSEVLAAAANALGLSLADLLSLVHTDLRHAGAGRERLRGVRRLGVAAPGAPERVASDGEAGAGARDGASEESGAEAGAGGSEGEISAGPTIEQAPAAGAGAGPESASAVVASLALDADRVDQKARKPQEPQDWSRQPHQPHENQEVLTPEEARGARVAAGRVAGVVDLRDRRPAPMLGGTAAAGPMQQAA